MNPVSQSTPQLRRISWQRLRRIRQSVTLFFLLVVFPAMALAQSASPFDTGFTNLQNLFTGTIAKVASLIAIVIGGYSFAHGEPGAKRTSRKRSNCGTPSSGSTCWSLPSARSRISPASSAN